MYKSSGEDGLAALFRNYELSSRSLLGQVTCTLCGPEVTFSTHSYEAKILRKGLLVHTAEATRFGE